MGTHSFRQLTLTLDRNSQDAALAVYSPYQLAMTDSVVAKLRLIHTSDWHLGQELHGHDRTEEHDSFLEWLLDQVETLEADALVVTGDVFDVANPPVPATARFYSFLRDAQARFPTLQIVVIAGNHDSAVRITLPGALLGAGRVHLLGQVPRCDGVLETDSLLIPLADHNGTQQAILAAVPYCRPGDLGRGDLASLYAEVADAASARAADLPVVLTGHLHLAGGEVSLDSERRIVIGGEEAQASSLFDARAAYVALGHLHRPQTVAGATLIRYAGSPIPMSIAERNYRHSITVVDIGASGTTATEVEIPRRAAFLSLPADGAQPLEAVEQLLASFDFGEPASRGARPFVEVCVLLDRPQPGVAQRVQAALEGKPIRLTRVRPVFPSVERSDGLAQRAETLSTLQPDIVFSELHAERHAGPPEADLARAFAELVIAVQADTLP